MINKKVKSIYPISISEVKSHLRIDSDNFEDDAYIENAVLKAATRYCENFINKDIALTSNSLTVDDFLEDELRVNEGNLISIDHIISDSSSLITDYTYTTYNDHFEIEFTSTIDSDPLKIEFTTGYDEGECPEEIKQAIFIKCGDFYDMERSSYTLGGNSRRDIAERILMPFKAIRW